MSKPLSPIIFILAFVIGLVSLYFSFTKLNESVKQKQYGEIVIKSDSTIMGCKLTFSKRKNSIDTIYLGQHTDNLQKEVGKLKILNRNAYLNMHPGLFKWIVFNSILIASCMAISVYIIAFILFIFRNYFKGLNLLFLILFVIIFFVILFFHYNLYSISLNQYSGAGIMETFGIGFNEPKLIINFVVKILSVLALLPLVGMFLLFCLSHTILIDNVMEFSKDELEELGRRFVSWYNLLSFYLALIVSVSVVEAGLQREMISEVVENIEHLYPKEFIYAYGLSYSFVLACIFIPSSLFLRYAASHPNNKRKSNYSEVNVVSLDNLKVVISILMPIISAVIQTVLGMN